MALIKMGTAARRARMGSTSAIRRALRAAGVPLVTLTPGVFAVEEEDLNRFLRSRADEPAAVPRPVARPQTPRTPKPIGASGGKPKSRKRRS